MVAGWGCPAKELLELNDGKAGLPPRTAVCKLHEMKKDVAGKKTHRCLRGHLKVPCGGTKMNIYSLKIRSDTDGMPREIHC